MNLNLKSKKNFVTHLYDERILSKEFNQVFKGDTQLLHENNLNEEKM